MPTTGHSGMRLIGAILIAILTARLETAFGEPAQPVPFATNGGLKMLNDNRMYPQAGGYSITATRATSAKGASASRRGSKARHSCHQETPLLCFAGGIPAV